MAYIGIDPNVGDITFQKFTGTGSATAFTLAQAVVSGEAIVVTIGNVVQEPGSSAAYTAQANTLTFSAAPANGDIITVRYFGRAVDQPTSYAMQLFKYVATASQTAFTGADANGAILVISGNDVDVYLNGVHLDSSDFTASGGDTITLGTGAALNDELVIRAYRAFSVTDTVSKASGGTFSGGVAVTGDLTVDTTTLKVDSTNNRVGVGTASPTRALQVESTAIPFRVVSSDSTGNIEIGDSTGSVRFGSGSSGAMRFFVGGAADFSGEAEKVRIDSDGLKFNGDTAAENALDDYEEGDWVPAGAASSGTAPSFSSSAGKYTKIGRLVTISASITNITAGGTANAQVQVTGLPFTPDGQDGFGACNFGQVTIGSENGVVAVADASEDKIVFMMNRSGAGRTGVDNQHISSGVSDCLFTISYITSQ